MPPLQPSFQPGVQPPFRIVPANAPVNVSAETPAVPVAPLNGDCDACLEIRPSTRASAAKQATLEATYGPVNKGALQQIKHATGDAEAPTAAAGPIVDDAEFLRELAVHLTQPERAASPELSVPPMFSDFGPFEIVPSK